MTTFNDQTAEFSTRVFATRQDYTDWVKALIRAIPDQYPNAGPCDEKVRRGYGSPYKFGDKLRQLCGDNDAAILQVIAGLNHPDTGLYFTEPGPDATANITVACYRVGA